MPPSVCPTMTMRLPACLKSLVTDFDTSGTRASADINNVPGMACFLPSAPRNSLFRLSLPDTKGVP